MKIDPRQWAQLLKLQLGTGSGLLPGSAASGPDFYELLQTYLGAARWTEAASAKAERLPTAVLARPSGMLPLRIADYDRLIEEAAGRYGVEPALIRAVIRAESGYDAYAVSSAGAKGLMQLMDETAASLGVDNPFDPAQNIDGGTRFLAFLLNKYNGNKAVALAAYNAGPGRIDRMGVGDDIELFARYGELPEETQGYIRKVLGYYEMAE